MNMYSRACAALMVWLDNLPRLAVNILAVLVPAGGLVGVNHGLPVPTCTQWLCLQLIGYICAGLEP